jgi:AcrR family transcriptional regulator
MYQLFKRDTEVTLLSTRKGEPMATPPKTLRRKPRQERSRERVDDVLLAAKRLIGEKGIDAVTMKEIATASEMPLATVYHYFPNKTAIIAMLYQKHSEEMREALQQQVETIASVDDILTAAVTIVEMYSQRLKSDPAIQDLLNAAHADKALQMIDIEETKSQSAIFCAHTSKLIAPHQRQDFERSTYLLFQLAGGAVRLALMMPPNEGKAIMADYRRLILGQLKQFEPA